MPTVRVNSNGSVVRRSASSSITVSIYLSPAYSSLGVFIVSVPFSASVIQLGSVTPSASAKT